MIVGSFIRQSSPHFINLSNASRSNSDTNTVSTRTSADINASSVIKVKEFQSVGFVNTIPRQKRQAVVENNVTTMPNYVSDQPPKSVVKRSNNEGIYFGGDLNISKL